MRFQSASAARLLPRFDGDARRRWLFYATRTQHSEKWKAVKRFDRGAPQKERISQFQKLLKEQFTINEGISIFFIIIIKYKS